jgi:alanyl-tRNA synthetase
MTGRSFNAHIEKKKSKCDYHCDRALTEEELRKIEEQVNEIISQDLPVTEAHVTRDEAAERYHMGKVPAEAGDTLRIVSVGDYDAVPCIGKHAASTGELGKFRISSSSYNDGVLRLRFKLDRP